MKINGCKILIIITFICSFFLPNYILENDLFGFDLVKYIFMAISTLVYIFIVLSEKKISKTEFFIMIIALFLCIIKKSIAPLYIVELMTAYRFTKYISKGKIKINFGVLFLSVLFVGIYSIIYFGYNGRYIYTGLREINQCGFAIFMLFLIVRKYNKKIGNILLILGLFTFSRNYLLCMAVFLIFDKIKYSPFFARTFEYINFKNLTILSIIFLLFLSISFNINYKKNNITEYQTGWNRYFNLYDSSNYFRFTVNTKLLEMYFKHPAYLITGLTDEKFYELSIDISNERKIPYRQIKPHNYFFSYLRIYGIFSIFIFIIMKKIIDQLVNKNNVPILIILFIYANVLGIGFSNYWLFLSIITLAVYKDDEVVFKNE